VRRRRTAEPPRDSPAGELLAWERECAAGAAAGDAQAAGRLVSARSWLDMLRATGNDPDVGALLAGFARDERVNGTTA
jgi:hypothetical protein